jgi:SAM-dependent methyltransferase|tara:strand:+ start:9401 stop:10063 length:663 start_codon:yes stop_codon:yes gene_type:complete
MTDTTGLQKEYSQKIQSAGAMSFIGSNNRNNFDEHSQTHFTYLTEQGLKPEHAFLDVGCGACRTAQKIVPYLNANHYFGLDRMPELIEFGLNEIFDESTVLDKQPKFSVNSEFNVDFVGRKVDYIWCQSLMSHLDESDIKKCLNNLKNVCHENTKVYFTYFMNRGKDREQARENYKSDSKIDLQYDKKVMDDIVSEVGYTKIFNGTIGHPRGQWMYICKI